MSAFLNLILLACAIAAAITASSNIHVATLFLLLAVLGQATILEIKIAQLRLEMRSKK